MYKRQVCLVQQCLYKRKGFKSLPQNHTYTYTIIFNTFHCHSVTIKLLMHMLTTVDITERLIFHFFSLKSSKKSGKIGKRKCKSNILLGPKTIPVPPIVAPKQENAEK